MKKTFPIILLLTVTVLSIYYVTTLRQTKLSPTPRLPTTMTSLESEEEEEGEGDKLQNIGDAMRQEFEKTKDPVLNRVPRERLKTALKVLKERQRSGEKAAIPNIFWAERGPDNVGGRTRGIWIDPNNTDRVLSAGVGGGLFETTNFTSNSTTWTPQDDFFANLAITTIAQVGNTDVLFFGTGEGWFNGGAVRGLGIWQSTDRGNSWMQLQSTNNATFSYVQKIKVDNAGNIYAATRAGGLQRSTDNGASWTQVVGRNVNRGDTDRAADVEISADGDIYVSLGVFSQGSVWKSSNNGRTWINATPSGSFERIEIATAPSDNNRVYILCQGEDSQNADNIFRSDDAGNSWTALPVPTIIDQGRNSNFTRGQAWYDLIAAVDPNDANKVYIAGVDMLRSTDAGANWEQISTWTLNNAPGYTTAQNLHADHHEILFFPGSSSQAISGTDGGLAYTTNMNIQGNNNFPDWTAKNKGYNVTQYYACALHPDTDTDYFLAGAQDNGTQQYSGAGVNSTVRVTGGDGGFCHIDQDNPDIQITAFTRNSYSLSTNGGASFTSFVREDGGSFINPTDYDNDADVLYAGNARGSYFRWNNPSAAGRSTDVVTVSTFNDANITHVMTSPNVANRVYFGLSNGTIVRIDNADTGTAKTGSVLNPGSNGSISCVAIEIGNEQHLLATYSNYGVTSIYESTNGGSSWTSVEGNLPDMPVRWAMFHPNNPDQALIATELGVWSTDDLRTGGTTNWGPTNMGLANVRTDMLQHRPSDDMVIAATHGRGLYSTSSFGILTVGFAEASSTASETGTTLDIGCDGTNDEGIRIVQIPVKISAPADVTVGISVDAASTMELDEDFEIVGSPTLSFTTTGANVQNIEIKIFDDAIVENEENLILNLNITDGTAVGGIVQHTLAVADNEKDPITGVNVNTRVIFSEDWETGIGVWSNDNPTGDRHNVWSIFNDFCGNIIDNQTAIVANFVDQQNFFCGYGSYDENIHLWRTVDATNRTNLNLTFDWISEGEVFNNTIYDYGQLVYSTDTNTPNWNVIPNSILINASTRRTSTISLPVELEGTTFLLGFRWRADGSIENGAPLGVDNIVLTGDERTPIEVATTVQNRTSYVGVGQIGHFYDDNGKIMATVEQTSGASDLGCVTLEIDGAGNGKQDITGIGDVTSKTFFVRAQNDGNYTLTLFFTSTELDVWGENKLKLGLVKTAGRIAAAEQAVFTPNELLTVNTYGDAENITYAYNGTTFSGFALTEETANEPLGVELLSFVAKTVEDAVQLRWTTDSQVNHKHFLLERSNDNINYQQIAVVRASVTNTKNEDYAFLDKTPFAGINYYRLTPVDVAGKSGTAIVTTAKVDAAIAARIYPNPVITTDLTVTLDAPQNATATIEIIDINGRSILRQNVSLQARENTVSLPTNSLSPGTYFVSINDGQQRQLLRFAKQ